MLSRWEKQTLHHWHHMSWTITEYDCPLSWVKSNSHRQSQTAIVLPAQIRGRNNWKHQDLNQFAIKLCHKFYKLWKSMEISSILFDLQTLELISQSLQSSQDPAKDPRGTPEHGTSIPLRRRIWNFNLSSRICEALCHINPTCCVEAELGIQTETETVLD